MHSVHMGALNNASALDLNSLLTTLRATGRTELIHYAGAAHRDLVAWHMCCAYLADRDADEATLKSRAVKAAWGWDVPASAFRKAVRS